MVEEKAFVDLLQPGKKTRRGGPIGPLLPSTFVAVVEWYIQKTPPHLFLTLDDPQGRLWTSTQDERGLLLDVYLSSDGDGSHRLSCFVFDFFMDVNTRFSPTFFCLLSRKSGSFSLSLGCRERARRL